MASRFSGPGKAYEGLAESGNWTGSVRFIEDRLKDPLRWRKPRRVFVCSMSDLFHDGAPDRQIARVFGIMQSAKQHTYIVLTKRPARMREWVRWFREEWLLRGDWEREYGHVWLGVSAENQEAADERIPILLDTPAAVRWVSVEPMLEAMDVSPFLCREGPHISPGGCDPFPTTMPALDWVVCGDESGPGARLIDPNWARSLRDQCIAAGVPFFLKQIDCVKMPALDGKAWDEYPREASPFVEVGK
jgi:protein gp37